MMPKMKLLLFVALIVPGLRSFAGNGPGKPRLYISTAKEAYQPGETMLFQAILLDASTDPRHSLHAELFDCHGTLLLKKIFPVVGQLSSGSLDLPADQKNDGYLLYCYTIDSTGAIEYDFIKRINPRAVDRVIPATWSVNDLSMEVFPEGHNFIANLKNTVLVKTFYKKEQPLSVTGHVINEKDEVVGTFQTNEQGYARLEFKPEEKGAYFIAVEDSAGSEKQVHFPKPGAGVTLSTVYQDSMLYIRWGSYSANQPPNYRIEISSMGEVVYDADLSFGKGASEVLQEVDPNQLPEGYLLVSLLQNGVKKVRRVIFNMHRGQKGSQIRIIDTIRRKEALVELPPYVNGAGYLQITGDAKQAGLDDYGRSVLTPVFDPAPGAALAFNDLLIGANQVPFAALQKPVAALQYISISGTLRNKEGTIMKNKMVNLIIVLKDLHKQFFQVQTDANGKLKFGDLIFSDTASVYYQLADKSIEKNDVVLEPDPSPVAETVFDLPSTYLSCSPANPAKAVNDNEKTLQQVVVKGQAERTETERFQEKYVSPQMNKKTGIRNEFDFIKDPQVVDNGNVLDFIRGRFAGLQIRILPDGSTSLTTTYKAPVNIYLNDQEIASGDMNAIAGLLVRDVAQIKYSPMSFKAKNGGGNPFLDPKAQDGGDLLIYTKKDFIPADAAVHGLPKIRLAGYDAERSLGDLSYWCPNYSLQKLQAIYIGTPATGPATFIRIEGLNKAFAPFSFSKELIFR
jgi:hypothetical protein